MTTEVRGPHHGLGSRRWADRWGFGCHPGGRRNDIWTGDNLPIMSGLNSESVDLIYLDPPFSSLKT